MLYSFVISPHLPAGDYGLQLRTVDRFSVPLGTVEYREPLFHAAAAVPDGPLPQSIDPDDLLTFRIQRKQVNDWLGNQHTVLVLGGDASVQFRPNLPPGRYEMRIRAEGRAAGDGERWPNLVMRQPGIWRERGIDSAVPRWYVFPFDWRGDEDGFQLYIKNPHRDFYPPPALPLYPDDLLTGDRAVWLHSIQVHRLE